MAALLHVDRLIPITHADGEEAGMGQKEAKRDACSSENRGVAQVKRKARELSGILAIETEYESIGKHLSCLFFWE